MIRHSNPITTATKAHRIHNSWILTVVAFIAVVGHAQDPVHSGVHPLHYDFTVNIPDTGAFLEGMARIRLQRVDGQRRLSLDLIGLRVDSVSAGGTSCTWTYDGHIIQIELPKTNVTTADTLDVIVRYRGIVRDGLIVGKDRLGRWTAFGDNWPQRARYWLPCIDRPDEKASVRWRVISSLQRQTIANGAFVRRIPIQIGADSSRVLTEWNESRPIPTYVMVIAVAPLVRYDLNPSTNRSERLDAGVAQSVYADSENHGFLPGPFSHASDIVQYFSNLIAPFPYEKLAHLRSSTRYGGMENASAIFYASAEFDHRTMQPGIIAHETAHQWFGDAVTEKTWPHLWLSEGFATYFEQLWTRHAFGEPAFRRELDNSRRQIFEAREVKERPVIDSLQTNIENLLNVNSYQKGARVLHMLRAMLGDSVFFGSLRQYYEAHKHGNAATDDLEAAFERYSRQQLRWFFDQWLRRPGYPSIRTAWEYKSQTGKVELALHQSNTFPPYRLPLVVEVLGPSGTRTRDTLDVQPVSSSVFTLRHTYSQKPEAVNIDPDGDLLLSISSD